MKVLILFFVLLLIGCTGPQLAPDAFVNASVACVQGAGWNGAPVTILYMGIDKGLAGTKGGLVNIECGAAKAGFTDSGNLSPLGQTIRVPVESTPMKLTPK